MKRLLKKSVIVPSIFLSAFAKTIVVGSHGGMVQKVKRNLIID